MNPAIQLEVVINNAFFSLTRREADVAVRPANAVPENLVGRRVGRLRSAIYASKTYLKKSEKKKDWADHNWVAPDESLAHLAQAKWPQERIPEERIVVRADSRKDPSRRTTMSEGIKELNESNFDRVVLQLEKLALVDFRADWCGRAARLRQ